MRLDKFICKSTELCKHQAIQCILAGEVSVNGKLVTNEATQVHENNTVLLSGSKLKARDFRYILMNKPASTVCSNIDEVYPSLFNYLPVDSVSELHIAGRLDADTTGLVLITDDGRWSFYITQPRHDCAKVYRVRLSRDIPPESANDLVMQFERGLPLQGEKRLTRPAKLNIIAPKEVLLTITEGKFHQVKRMFAAVGNKVVSLHREQIGDICLDVDVGQWRFLSKNEVESFITKSIN
ncbi:pseudouridine synthase [Marinomonas sp. M1K-6]|uniref:Pseudouridine synthase n=1 Tax=Marinomonas profundi TaxID=2726122 RepID=A0A847R7J3_9GAMM|nr:pseudouridine synthase [Marinomonas profundi]NLQ16240.1 pseudouridine synthase [Marinomonas profundi]UDV03183.1 pseudouridine synthase [Marinomonas profundi]